MKTGVRFMQFLPVARRTCSDGLIYRRSAKTTALAQRILEAGAIESIDPSAIPRIRTPQRAAVLLRGPRRRANRATPSRPTCD